MYFDYTTLHCVFRLKIGFFHFLVVSLRCRGSNKATEKCTMAISDFVLMYNQAQEGLYGPSKNDRTAYDFHSELRGMKQTFVEEPT